MSRRRNTLDGHYVLDYANAQLARADVTEEFRKGICVMIEKLLMESGNYKGFQYVDWANGGFSRWVKDGRPDDKDSYLGPEYKREYYQHPKLK